MSKPPGQRRPRLADPGFPTPGSEATTCPKKGPSPASNRRMSELDNLSDTPPEAVILMKMALGLIDAFGGRAAPVARHLNAAIEISMGPDDAKPIAETGTVPGASL